MDRQNRGQVKEDGELKPSTMADFFLEILTASAFHPGTRPVFSYSPGVERKEKGCPGEKPSSTARGLIKFQEIQDFFSGKGRNFDLRVKFGCVCVCVCVTIQNSFPTVSDKSQIVSDTVGGSIHQTRHGGEVDGCRRSNVVTFGSIQQDPVRIKQ
ncbi:hypothetical protein RUM43_006880 [Polyplax serrata]|uniref:Uncharacterized protein n=1 Tax=Polyplax serrata TaxID=468196 RepID=A0AAN8S0U9_POLSC